MDFMQVNYDFLESMRGTVQDLRDMFWNVAEDENRAIHNPDEFDSVTDGLEAWRDTENALRDMQRTYESMQKFMEAWDYIKTYNPRFAAFMSKELNKRG